MTQFDENFEILSIFYPLGVVFSLPVISLPE